LYPAVIDMADIYSAVHLPILSSCLSLPEKVFLMLDDPTIESFAMMWCSKMFTGFVEKNCCKTTSRVWAQVGDLNLHWLVTAQHWEQMFLKNKVCVCYLIWRRISSSRLFYQVWEQLLRILCFRGQLNTNDLKPK